MGKRAQPCDLCGAQRLRWQRLCNTCFHALPPFLRGPVLDNWRTGNKPAWREAKKAASDFLAARAHAHVATITADRAYTRTAAMLGERDA